MNIFEVMAMCQNSKQKVVTWLITYCEARGLTITSDEAWSAVRELVTVGDESYTMNDWFSDFKEERKNGNSI